MAKTLTGAVLCLSCVWMVAPALASPNTMPQGKRDEMAQRDTKHEVTAQQKENREANRNVDTLIQNRK
ncbi:hypothetical protein [Methylobacterium gossipiicola]|uniref:Lipoprotein n=1 Tax=Methylobacterium gossipiicola TaxID=582675 RepID=A0A1I2WJ17_9HYPH|nr:hypothetical protein [Methylobacterium gossipiicola]SFH00617.1 hypothetical protein SAMN05192565_12323 [Methylobacterium gossipiicola]